MAPSRLPVANAIQPFWRSELHPLDNHRSTPALPSQVDIVVIGAGYAGASVAYHIQNLCRDQGIALPSMAILEAREACSGATGRNGGHLKPDPYNRPASLALSHGVELAAECARFEAATLRAVKAVIDAERIDCDFVLTRAVDALMGDAIHARIAAGAGLLRDAGVDVMQDVHYEPDAARAEQLSGVKGAKACLTYSAGHLWPYKLILALLQKAVDAGANLQTHTPVVGVAATADAEGYYAVTTRDRGVVRARQVVYATNAYTAAVLPELAGRIVPVRGICSRIVVPHDRKPAPVLPHSYIVRWSPSEYEYMIPRTDGSIIVGGARSKYYADLDSWYDNVDDDKLITAGDAHRHFDGYMQNNFRGWEHSGAYTESVWTGIMGYSADSCPFIGPLPSRPNQYVVAGFTGHGMPQIFLSAKGIAQMAVTGASFHETGIPRIYQVTEERLASKQNTIIEGWASHESAKSKL
ncbi:FAD dependent oxidoreductase [Coniella lustricola]|uniref:FAD dependent oxidoreductase n=1 Tax=Coniella lustricola TaxID=2025994 RepID=A0A2T3A406_9PEZI|nr:FAD dependent oxidoreductase [Coniella lustricola]